MLTAIQLYPTDESVKTILEATFPGYKGRNVEAIISDSVSFHGTLWDSGYRRTYKIFNLNTKEVLSIPTAPFLKSSPIHENPFPIEKGFVVVVFCEGRRDHIEIHSSADNLTAMLPKPVELSENEKRVLLVTRCRKSSYAGIAKYREYEAMRIWGMALEQYNEAKTSLIEKRMLNRAGAITIEGRNQIQGEYI